MNLTNEKDVTFREALFSGEMDLEGMDALLSLYRELYPLRQSGPGSGIRLKSLADDEVSMRLSEGFTLIETGGLLPEGQDLSGNVREVAGILAGYSEDPDSVKAVADHLLEEPSRFSAMVDAFMADGDSGLREKTRSWNHGNPEVVLFIVFNVLKTVFLSAGRIFTGIKAEQWNHGRCPVCGGDPTVSYMVGEGGKRYLICHRCETHWRFRRLACPFCEHESPGESRFLFIEEPQYEKITGYVCNECKCYIKTWRVEDEELGALHPEVEDLKTPGFDAAVESEGYRRGSPNIFGVLVSNVAPERPKGEEGMGKI